MIIQQTLQFFNRCLWIKADFFHTGVTSGAVTCVAFLTIFGVVKIFPLSVEVIDTYGTYAIFGTGMGWVQWALNIEKLEGDKIEKNLKKIRKPLNFNPNKPPTQFSYTLQSSKSSNFAKGFSEGLESTNSVRVWETISTVEHKKFRILLPYWVGY